MKRTNSRIWMYLLFTLLFTVIMLFTIPKEERATVFNANTYCLNHNIDAPKSLGTPSQRIKITPEAVYINDSLAYSGKTNRTVRMFQGLAYLLSQPRGINSYTDTSINNDPIQQAIWAYVKYINSNDYQKNGATYTFSGNMGNNSYVYSSIYFVACDIANQKWDYNGKYNYNAEFNIYIFNVLQSILKKNIVTEIGEIGYLTLKINKKRVDRNSFIRC